MACQPFQDSMLNNLYINWTKENEVGIKIIDEQHRGIVSTMNSLYYFIQSGHNEEIIKPTIIILQQYIKVHFQTEEELMLKAEYPDVNAHIQMHRDWMKKSKVVFYEALNNQDPKLLLNFLKDWWIQHIRHEDVKYTSYVEKLITHQN